MFQFIRTLHKRLSFSRRRHQWFHHTRKTNFLRSSFQLIERFGIKIFSSFQAQFLGSKITDSLAIHSKIHSTRTGYYLNTFFFKIIKTLCADGLNFRYNNIRLMFAHYTFQSIAVKHTEHLTLISHLHGRRSGIGIAGNDILAFALGRNNELLTQFTGT